MPSLRSDTLAPATGSSLTAATHSLPGISAGSAPRTPSAMTSEIRM